MLPGLGGLLLLHSGLFLAKVIRPIYNAIFDELYESVEVDEHDGRDKKKLHRGFEHYLPPDAANYDDWNELFCDPRRLVEALLLENGTHLFDRPLGERFRALPKVDWPVALDRYETKTHRAALLEVHEPLLALEKLHVSSSHTAVRSSVRARDGRLAFYVVHARVSRRRPRSNPPRLDARDRSNPKLARAPIARTLARASSRALALARVRRHRRVARTFCASTILSLMVDDRSIKQ